MKKILVRYGELALKGRNRIDFEKQLKKNIEFKLRKFKASVVIERGQLVVDVSEKEIELAVDRVKQVFGISWLAAVESCKSETFEIVRAASVLAQKKIKEEKTFAVRASRSDKSLPFSSKEVENKAGDEIRRLSKLKVDLSNPDLTVYVCAGRKRSHVFDKKIKGLGGLPVGSSGKVLSLLSGGFDSIVSSYLLSKRGARVDFLHFHVFPASKGVLSSKMPKIWKGVSEFSLSKRVFLASYLPFQMRVIDLARRDERLELVVFRRLMVKVGEKLADKHGYQALVLGDSLGQVASQTMENIVAVDDVATISIFRPLIGFDKVEIIDLVKRIGLENAANEAYKDCCSLVSTHPATRADLVKVKLLEERLEVENAVKEIVASIEEIII